MTGPTVPTPPAVAVPGEQVSSRPAPSPAPAGLKRPPVAVTAPPPVARTVSASSTGSSALPANTAVDALSSPDAEIELCGWLLGTTPDMLPFADRLMGHLADNDFAHPIYKAIWSVARGLIAKGQVVGGVALFDTATRSGLNVGGIELLAQLIEDPLVQRTDEQRLWQAAETVKGYALRRQVDAILRNKLRMLPTNASLEAILNEASDDLSRMEVLLQARNTSGPRHISEEMAQVYEEIHNPEEAAQVAVRTNLDVTFDEVVRIVDGDLVLVAGRPSMGKTALALNIGRNVGMDYEQNRKVLFFSGEMVANLLAWRSIASETGMSANNWRQADLTDPVNTEALDEVRARFAPLQFDEDGNPVSGIGLWVDDTSGMTLPYIRAEARKFVRKHGKALIIVDYLQLIAEQTDSGSRNFDERTSVGRVSTGLKGLARELECPVIALAQLNRSLEARTNKRPIMSDLRESGKLEQDADTILFPYRDSVYNPDADPTRAEIIIGKQRSGAIGTIHLGYEASSTRFYSLHERTSYAPPAQAVNYSTQGEGKTAPSYEGDNDPPPF